MVEAQAEMEEEGFDLILSLDDTDVEKDDKTSPVIRQSTDAFTTNEVIAVLERISSSTIKSEAEIATKILRNTRGKKDLATLDCFVSVFVEAFNKCNGRNDIESNLFDAWKRLAGDAHSLETSVVVYQHVLQHFWSCVTLQGKSSQSVEDEYRSDDDVSADLDKDEAEREAIRRHAGWAVKRARDLINSGATIVSIKKSKDENSPVTEVTKTCLLSFFDKFGVDLQQNTGKYLFIVNNAILEFFIVLHKEVEDFIIRTGIDKDTVVLCLQYLSCNEHIRAEWKKVVGERSGEEEAASIIILQQIVSMFLKSKQQIIREQLHLKPQKESKSLRASLFHGKKGD
ncbi:Hypothetical predicted protein [Paramuricea clavata]|uniref:Uncharacterized protein n=1 Tax=Paramuricea clavata TaxID=317549 RepID=A0A6S7LDU2_PARCT|nr:Hypothetical predicted protein [Paramuricea clavata]